MYGSKSVGCFVLMFLLKLIEFPASGQNQLAQPDDCGILNRNYLFNRKISTEYNEYPWMAFITYTDSRKKDQILCTGVLYNKRNVLVPAHCVHTDDISDDIESYTVNFDDCNDWGVCRQPQSYDVAEVAVHPDFTVSQVDNDIAVLTLRQDVKFSETVKPICLLPKTNNGDYTGQRLEIVGYPFFKKDKQKTIAYVTSHTHCSEAFADEISISKNNICAFLHKDIVYASGAALMGVDVINGELKNMYLIGLVTWGTTQENSPLPSVFMRIWTHKDWILYNSYTA